MSRQIVKRTYEAYIDSCDVCGEESQYKCKGCGIDVFYKCCVGQATVFNLFGGGIPYILCKKCFNIMLEYKEEMKEIEERVERMQAECFHRCAQKEGKNE